MRLRVAAFLCGIISLVTMVGCGGKSGGNPTPPPATLTITTTSPLTQGTVGTPYSATLAASGGTAPYTWSVTTGSLPAGITLSSSGALTGTPTAAGFNTFTIQVKDSASTAQTATLSATLVIAAAPPAKLTITTTSPLTPGTVGTLYSTTLAASGGTIPYTWSIVTGTLPAGLMLNPTTDDTQTASITGTPTTAGTSNLVLQVQDGANPAQTATLTATLVISSVVPGGLTITTTSLPAGNAGSPYVAQLSATGGVAPYTWTVTGGALPAGIALSTTGALSGTPGSAGSTPVTFTVTDSSNVTASAMLTITINAATGTVPDNYYSFVFAGTAPQGTPPAANGVAINGIIQLKAGQIISGFYDENSNTGSPVTNAMISGGTLTLGTNGLGQLVLTTATTTMTFALASPASVSTGGLTPIRMIEYDDATGSGTRGSGVIDPTPAAPTTSGISGSFAFLLSGTDTQQNQQALIGSFQTDGAGNITGGKADANQVVPVNGVPTREVATFGSMTGTYSVDTNGRGLLSLTLGSTPFNFSFYEVSPTEWLIISLDPATLNSPLVSGIAYHQAAGPFTPASLPTTSVLEVSGVKTDITGVLPPVPDVSVGLTTSDGAGNLTYTFDEYNGALTSGNVLTVPYSVDATTGRTTATAGSATQPILYIIDTNSAFYLGVGASGQSGMIVAQTGAPFTLASFSGNYLGGSLPLVLTSVLNESGLVVADNAGNVTFTTYRSGPTGLLYQNNVVVGTYTVDATGRGVITAPDGATRIFYVISPNRVAYLTSDGGGYLGDFQR